MATETLVPSGDDNGWPTGNWDNIEETIASADGLTLETNIDDDVVRIDLTDSAITDGDTVNSVTVNIRAKDTGSGGKNSLAVDLVIGGTGQGEVVGGVMNNSYATYTFTDAVNWDVDWTAAQLDGMQLDVRADQTGKAETADWQIDAIDVIIDYTAASSGGLFMKQASLNGINVGGPFFANPLG